MMCRDTFWLCYVTCLALLITFSKAIEIFVARNGTSDSLCLIGSAENPCSNLTMVIENVSMSDNVTISICSGSFNLLASTHTTFQSVDRMVIQGIEDSAIIQCVNGAGLGFVESKNVEISNVIVKGCGIEYNSTNLDTETGSFMTFNASLYFLLCVNISIVSTEVSYSKGIGIQIYATTGVNKISHSRIINNPAMGRLQLRGGGLYIEFPYCMPGNCTRDNPYTNVPVDYVSNSSYEITHTNFSNNHAIVTSAPVLFPYKTTHNAFGRGGGLSLFLKGEAGNNVFNISDCNFSSNSAFYGGGFLVQFEDSSSENELIVTGNHFVGNSVSDGGGGLKIGILSIYDTVSKENHVQLQGNAFVENNASWGGGTALYIAKETTAPTNLLDISNCTWRSNTAKVGSAVDLSVYRPVMAGMVMTVSFMQCQFLSNSVDYTPETGKPLGTGAMYLNAVSATFEDYVLFDGNYDGSALVVINAFIFFANDTEAIFKNNIGRNGGAISMLGGACIQLQKNTTFVFNNNTATGLGGAIYNYYGGSHELYAIHDCFVEYYDSRIEPNRWETSLHFNHNIASQQTNAIFSTSIIPCLWGVDYNPENQLNLSKSVFCWNDDVAEWMYDGKGDIDTCDSYIWTDPAFFNSSKGQSISIIPGWPQTMPFTAVDDQGGNVNNLLIFTIQSQTEGVEVDSEYQYSAANKILLYTNRSNSTSKGLILLQTLGPRVLETQLTVTFKDCPLGFELNDKGACACHKSQEFRGYVRCNEALLQTDILQGYWIGVSPTNDSLTVVGFCHYCIRNQSNDTEYITLLSTDEEVQLQLCGELRNGTLCSSCVEGYAPAVNNDDYNCVECKNKLLIGAVVLHKIVAPLVLFFVLFIFFCYYDVSPATGTLNRVIFFTQMVTTAIRINENVKMSHTMVVITKSLKYTYTTLYDIWNLEFCHSCFPDYCLYPNTTAIQVIMTNYAAAFFPLLVVLLVMAIFSYNGCCKPCQNFFERHGARVKTALMLLILLSYVKIAVITTYVLTPAYLYTSEGSEIHDSVLYYDSDIIYFGRKDHLKYAIPALLFGGVYSLLLPLLLIVYRFDKPEKTSGFFNHLLKEFQGEFKGGKQEAILNDSDIVYKDDWCGIPENRLKYGIKARLGRFWKSDEEGTVCSCLCRYTPFWVFWVALCRPCANCCSCWFFTSWRIHHKFSDFRWMAGFFFLLRVLLLLCSAMFFPIVQYTFQLMLCLFMIAFITLFEPYEELRNNKLDRIMFIGLAIIIGLNMLQYSEVISWSKLYLSALLVQYAVVAIPALWMLWKIVKCCLIICISVYQYRRGHAYEFMHDVSIDGMTENDPLIKSKN